MDDCFYVGKTDDIEKRFFEHTSGKGALWTKLHRPIKIEKTIDNCDPFDEDKYVKKYMTMYGIDKVRGGSYVKEVLDEEQIRIIQKEINASMDLCINCGQAGHFIRDCKEKKTVANKIFLLCKFCNKKFDTQNEVMIHENFYYENSYCKEMCIVSSVTKYEFSCKFCNKEFETQKGATYHENVHCKNKTESFSCKYCNKEFETQKGTSYHENFYCKNKVAIFLCEYCDKEFETEKGARCHENLYCKKKTKEIKCFNCGREGHLSNECYATKHIKGYIL